MFFLKVSLLHIYRAMLLAAPTLTYQRSKCIDAHTDTYALFLELRDTVYDFVNFCLHLKLAKCFIYSGRKF